MKYSVPIAAFTPTGTFLFRPNQLASTYQNNVDQRKIDDYIAELPQQSVDKLELEYLENVAALDELDEKEWIQEITLLDMGCQEYTLDRAIQQAIAVDDAYYESCREEQARRDAARLVELEAERKRETIFTEQF
jgi:hypothetical protein